VGIEGGVAARLASLCLDPKGRLSDRLLASAAVRAGLLMDLALAGRVESTEDSVVIDPTPTGFPPADRLLAAITVEPERSLDGWLDERRIGLRDVAESAVRTGRWESVGRALPGIHRYRDTTVDQATRDRSRDPDDGSGEWTAEDAAVTAIALVSGLLESAGAPVAAEPLLACSGSARWLLEAVTEHLRAAAEQANWTSVVLNAAGPGPF
jgi:hypothetical protein